MEEGTRAIGLLTVENSGEKSISDVALKIKNIDVLSTVLPERGGRAGDIAASLAGVPLVINNDYERPPRKDVLLNRGDSVTFKVFDADRKSNTVFIIHAVRVAAQLPRGSIPSTSWHEGIDNRLPSGKYRIRVRAEGRDVVPRHFTYIVELKSDKIMISTENN